MPAPSRPRAPPNFSCNVGNIDPTRYILVPTENSAYQSWQVRLNYHSYCKVFERYAEGEPGGPTDGAPSYTRIVYTEQPPSLENGRIYRDALTHQPLSDMMPTWVALERNPLSAAAVHDFAVWNRALAVQKWMDAQPRNSSFWQQPAPGPSIALYESDMIFLRWIPNAFTAQGGTLRAPPQGYMNPENPSDGRRNPRIVAAFCKKNCEKMKGMDVPWILTRDDLYELLIEWMAITRAITLRPPLKTWIADMWGLQIAAAHAGLTFEPETPIVCHIQYPLPHSASGCVNAAMHFTYDVEVLNNTRLENMSMPGKKVIYFFSKRASYDGRPTRRQLLPLSWQDLQVPPAVKQFMQALDAAQAAWWPEDGPMEGPGHPPSAAPSIRPKPR